MLLNMMIYNWSTMLGNMFDSQTLSDFSQNFKWWKNALYLVVFHEFRQKFGVSQDTLCCCPVRSIKRRRNKKEKKIINWFSVEWFVNRCIFLPLKGLQNGYDLLLIYCIKSTKNNQEQRCEIVHCLSC